MRNLNKNPSCKLSFKHWDQKVSAKMNHSDLTMDQFYDLCRTLAYAAGFGDKSVKEYFGEY